MNHFPGLAITTILCGVGPGLLFIALAATVGSYVFFPPCWDFKQLSFALAPTGGFVASALVILGMLNYFQCC